MSFPLGKKNRLGLGFVVVEPPARTPPLYYNEVVVERRRDFRVDFDGVDEYGTVYIYTWLGIFAVN